MLKQASSSLTAKITINDAYTYMSPFIVDILRLSSTHLYEAHEMFTEHFSDSLSTSYVLISAYLDGDHTLPILQIIWLDQTHRTNLLQRGECGSCVLVFGRPTERLQRYGIWNLRHVLSR